MRSLEKMHLKHPVFRVTLLHRCRGDEFVIILFELGLVLALSRAQVVIDYGTKTFSPTAIGHPHRWPIYQPPQNLIHTTHPLGAGLVQSKTPPDQTIMLTMPLN